MDQRQHSPCEQGLPLTHTRHAGAHPQTSFSYGGNHIMRRPEFAPLMAARLARDPRLAARLAYFYDQLRARPRAWRRRFGRRARLSLGAAALLLALSRAPASPPVHAGAAATIVVANGEIAVADNGLCSFAEAIQNANDTNDGVGNPPGHDDCAAGNPAGADTIALPAAGAFNFTNRFAIDDSYGYLGLPLITSTITVEGNGSTLTRTGNQEMRFFTIVTNEFENRAGDLTINNLTMSNGRMDYYYGGAIYSYVSRLALNNCTISGNRAAGGGGIFAYQSEVSISGGAISNNDNSEGGQGAGGGLYAGYSTLTLSDTTINGNDAYLMGGGVAVSSTSLTMTNVTVSGNTAEIGAGVYINYGNGTITDSTISDNDGGATWRGGGEIGRAHV